MFSKQVARFFVLFSLVILWMSMGTVLILLVEWFIESPYQLVRALACLIASIYAIMILVTSYGIARVVFKD